MAACSLSVQRAAWQTAAVSAYPENTRQASIPILLILLRALLPPPSARATATIITAALQTAGTVLSTARSSPPFLHAVVLVTLPRGHLIAI